MRWLLDRWVAWRKNGLTGMQLSCSTEIIRMQIAPSAKPPAKNICKRRLT